MIASKIQKSRKKGQQPKRFGSLVSEIHPMYEDLSDSLYLIMKRLDELRFLTLEDWMTDDKKRSDVSELLMAARRYEHVEAELQGTVYELFWLLDLFGRSRLRMKFAEHQTLISKGLGSDTRPVHGLSKSQKETKRFME